VGELQLMGTGSFGGGSGGFGGGGSGRIGGASITGKKTDSLLDRITALIGLTKSINENPEIAVTRRTIAAALQSPVRRRLQGILSAPFVDNVFRALFQIPPMLGKPPSLVNLGAALGLPPSTFTLVGVVSTLVDRWKSREVDERYVEITRRALNDLFLATVDNDYRAFAQQPAPSIVKFDQGPFQSLCGRFLASIIREVVRHDVLSLSPQAQASVQTATQEIADRWVDIFESKYRDGKAVRHRDMMRTLSQNYSAFAISERFRDPPRHPD